jgi:type I restriction enzyme S subunit
MSDEWKRLSICDVAEVVTGATPPTSDKSNYGGNIPFVSPSDLGINKYIFSASKTLTVNGAAKARLIPAGSILFTCIGATIGKMGIAGCDLTTNQQINSAIPKYISSEFLYYALAYISVRVKRIAGVQAVPIINKTEFENQMFYCPINQDIQDDISAILSTWDQAIEKTERLIAAKEKWLKILQQKLIFIPSQEDKQIQHRTIREISEPVQRKSVDKDYPILTISSASGFVLQEEKYSRFMAGKSLEDYVLLHRGEFAYNKGNSLRYQFGCIFPLKDYEAALVPHVYVCFKLHDDIDADYVSHVFKADYLKKQLGALVNTGIRNNGLLNISSATFMKVTVPVPQPEKQKQIASILNTAEKEIDLLKKQLEVYRRQKRGLMQKLLTGQWRVKISGRKICGHGE